MAELTTYELDGRIASVTMDDGKVNAFSVPMLRSIHAAMDQAERDVAVVVLTGRATTFSAGFDLKTFAGGSGKEILEMLTLGATLAERILAFPTPVVTACNGNALPAGAFLLMSADLRIGAEGPFRLGCNEVAIGLTIPWFAIELARHRLHPAAFDRTIVNATMFSPSEAVDAGLLDKVVDPEALRDASLAGAAELAELDMAAHAATKRRARAKVLAAVHEAIESELTVENFATEQPRA
ncbi:MAG TPA: crotonase/enoyl-CoA hydratase family protein [Acidimicrobiales bacterium]|nr:crotonase/enoyl-CoA hydratase family protein [Acidimicrobiales bacterium]